MKMANQKVLLKRIMYDRDLSANEIRLILYCAEKQYIGMKEVIDFFGCKVQYANKIVAVLEKKNYLKKHKKFESSKTYMYTIIDDVAPAQTTIEDF